MENKTPKDYSHIKGWGIDADPKNDPTYPMKHRTDAEQEGYSWERPTLQDVDIEVLHSIERPNVTAVFGTSMPPSGLSGMIRRFAFKHSENSYLHWLPLLMADRVNVVEGVLDDFAKGTVPNIFAEKGWKADWEHNRSGLIQKVGIMALVTTAAVLLLTRKKNS
ncbi:hypothetical protein Q4E40_01230 [Pontibacter sp. BT731]|uniref:hypothetical protein n=1 Tax=Pontibacter coccineus TaxID=3063328 RepID=UPI0026E30984|nr:hypothetical protein [Pontibacter sp. BT731]MDO6388728.1 hypothetical protein [Pontibacter sp. BT731]